MRRLSPEECHSDVEHDEKEEPHDVDEVPVQRHRGDADVMLRRELAAGGAVEDQRQQDQPTQDVGPVKPGHREKGAGEGVGREREAASERSDELVQLPELEAEAEQDGDDLEDEEPATVVVCDRVGGEVAGDTAGEQHHRVDGGYVVERIQREGGRPRSDIELVYVRRRRRRPHEVGAEQVEVHREEASEEHDLGGQEDVHAHHSRLDGRVLDLFGPHRRDGHQWWTSLPGEPGSAGYMRTSSTSTQPATPIRKMIPPIAARVIRATEAKGMAPRARNSAPKQMRKGQLLFGKMWMPS